MLLLETRNFDGGSSAVGGETATTGEIFDVTLESMRLTENANSALVTLERAYDARIDAVRQATGVTLFNPVRDTVDSPGTMAGFERELPDPHAAFQKRLEELAQGQPDFADVIAANRPVLEDAYRMARAADGNFENVWARSPGGALAWGARIAGGFAGAFHDPLNVAMLALGPWGQAGAGVRGLVWMGLKTGAANAAGEAAIQPFVQSWRKEAGLPSGLDLAAQNIAFAGAFGFGLDAGVRSAVRGVRRLAGKPYLAPSLEPQGSPVAGGTVEGAQSSQNPITRLDEAANAAPEGSPLRRAAEGDAAALREVAEQSGLKADPVVRAGLDALENEAAFLPPERVDDGENLRQISAAMKVALGIKGALPPGEAVSAPPAKDAPNLADSTPARLGATETLEGKPVAFVALDPQKVTTDAETFQFKSQGDAAGVTDRLRGVKRWDPLSAGKSFVFERMDGELVIADGHQRLGLAKRLADQKPQLHAYVFREADGWTPGDVRAHAALKNMRELSGASTDMAKVMRERPDLVDGSLPLSDGKMREAAMLAKLSPEAFDAVVAGRLPPAFAALIGDHVSDASRHVGLLNELAAADLANSGQARFFLAQLMELPTTTETQITLFGEEAVTRTVMVERAKVLDASLKALRGDKRIFGLLEREARRIAESGNVLDREGNAARAQSAAELAELIERLSTTRGVVATLLNDAATSVARGYNPTLAARAFTRRIGDLLDAEGLNGLLKAADEPPAGGRLDDPAGPEAKAQIEALERDADQGVMFALSSGGGSVVRFRKSGNAGRLEVLRRQYADLSVRVDDARTEISEIGSKAARTPIEDERVSELSGTVDELRAQIAPLLDEMKQLEDARFEAQRATGLFGKIADASDAARKLRSEIADLEKRIPDLEEALAASPGDFTARRQLRVARERLNEAVQAEDAAERAVATLRGELDDVKFALRGFYSPALRAAEDIAMQKGTGERFWKQITKTPGVKKDELDWMGLQEFLSGKASVTKAEVLDYMRAHQVELDERVLGAGDAGDIQSLAREQFDADFNDRSESFNEWLYDYARDKPIRDAYIARHGEDAFDDADPVDIVREVEGQTGVDRLRAQAFDQFKSDYLEAAQRKLVEAAEDEGADATKFSGHKIPGGENYRELLIRLPKLEGKYTSKHFQDQEIVHLRVDDRVGSNGEKVLFINEVQSDLHQAGRRSGYGKLTDEARAKLADEYADLRANPWGDEAQSRIEELRSILSEQTPRVPDAPFKGDLWLELALKRALLYAAENGYDAVSWARSDQIAKAVGAEPEKLALQYDQKIGRFLDKYTQKWGGKVERFNLEEDGGGDLKAILAGISDGVAGKDNPILRITPEMRASVIDGQSLFAASAFPTLANATLSERASLRMLQLRADIDKAMSKMLPFGWRHSARDRLVYRGLDLDGMADPYERVIYVSMAALDPLERAFEEAGHALRSAKVIPDADYEILRAEARRLGAREHFEIDQRYGEIYGERWKDNPGKLEDALEEEAIMQMVAAHARGKTFGEPTSEVRRILDRIVKFLRAVAEALKGRGFRTYDDVFQDMVSGSLPRVEEFAEIGASSRAMAMRDVLFSVGDGGSQARREGNLRDLINGAAAEGKLGREEAADMLDRLAMLEKHYRDNPAAAGEQLTKELDATALERKRVALLQDAAHKRNEQLVRNYRDARGQADPAKATIALLEHNGQTPMPEGFSSVVGRRQAILGMAMGDFEAALHAFRRTWVTGSTRNRARLDNVVREAFGEGAGDQAAAGFAKSWGQITEALRQRFNAAGGHIGKLENWGLPQHHDRRALLNAGMETWIERITPRLDPARMRNPLTGAPMLAADLRASLEYIFRNITADGWVEREPSMARFGVGMVANQRAEQRFLIFKNADAWLEYQAEFGGGADPFAAMMNHIRGMAEDIAAMEILGPNPRGMLTWLQQLTLQQAALRASGQAAHFPVVAELTSRRMAASGNWLTTKGAEDYARSAVVLTENMWDIYRGAAGAAVNQRTADAFGAVRSLNVASKLGGATLSAVTDLGFQKMARYFAGLPILGVWDDQVKAFAASKRDAVRGGLILDSAANILHQEARWAGAMQGPEWSNYLADRVIASSGLAAWTQAGKHAFGLAIQGEFASRAGLPFAALPASMQRLFQRYGLSAADWDAIRGAAVGDPDFLTPAMVRSSGVENLAERYLEMILQETEYAVPTGGLKAQAMSYGGLKRGVARDEVWRSAGQFKMFGLSVAMLQGQRIANEMIMNGFWRGAGYASALLITTTLFGALAIQLKELAKGRDPRDMNPMTDPKFWGHAVLQSGGLGIYGDFLFAETNRMGGGLVRTLAGPTADVASGLLALGPGNMAQWVRGEKTNLGREVVRFLGQNTPGGSNWYLRLAYERVLLDALQRLADPDAHAAFRRKVQQQKRDYGNAFFWVPGETAPQRAPALLGGH